jgi:arylsulfatase A-like enzyme
MILSQLFSTPSPRWRGLGAESILRLLGCLTLLSLFSCQEQKPPNVLFIAIDDLRPDLGCYGQSFVHSPNIDRLAEKSFVFRHHYVSVPTCGASRHSLLTGMRPSQRKHLRNDVSRVLLSRSGPLPPSSPPETFIHHLRRNGYYTVGIGKISHAPGGRAYAKEKEPESDSLELPNSWDEMLLDAGKWGDDWGAFFAYANGKNRYYYQKQVKPYEAADVADEGYPDGLTANLAMQKLQDLSQQEQPFFLGVGFFKPHLPFTAPQKYWDLYEESDIPLSPVPDLPQGVHPASLHQSGELNQYALGEEKAGLDHNLSAPYARKLRHAYYACVSYVDAQVGKVLTELERLGLSENTVVVLWSDHGWHLGDHRVWGKHTVFEASLRSPLIIKIPGEENRARMVEKVVSSVDLYPTLMDLTQQQMPHETDGRSMVPLMLKPQEAEWEQAAYSYFGRRISLRTGYYRFSRYFRQEGPNVELFDHRQDPHEQHNLVAEEPELVRDFLEYTPHAGWDWPDTEIILNSHRPR